VGHRCVHSGASGKLEVGDLSALDDLWTSRASSLEQALLHSALGEVVNDSRLPSAPTSSLDGSRPTPRFASDIASPRALRNGHVEVWHRTVLDECRNERSLLPPCLLHCLRRKPETTSTPAWRSLAARGRVVSRADGGPRCRGIRTRADLGEGEG